MNRCSYFVRNRALFGSYPTQHGAEELEEHGVRYYINLTNPGESKIVPFETKYTELSFPIPDRHVPLHWGDFAKFILRISKIIRELEPEERVYVFCKGGHGRSGLVVACLLVNLVGMPPSEALTQTSRYHSKRPEMKDKWRKIGAATALIIAH